MFLCARVELQVLKAALANFDEEADQDEDSVSGHPHEFTELTERLWNSFRDLVLSQLLACVCTQNDVGCTSGVDLMSSCRGASIASQDYQQYLQCRTDSFLVTCYIVALGVCDP